MSGRVVDLATGNGRRIENLVLCCDYSLPVMMGSPVDSCSLQSESIRRWQLYLSFRPARQLLPVDRRSARPHRQLGDCCRREKHDRTPTGCDGRCRGSGNSCGSEWRAHNGGCSAASQAGEFRIQHDRPADNAPVSGPLLLVPKGSSSLDLLREQLLKSAKLPSKTMGPDGRFELRRVSPGAYVLEVRTSGVTLHEQEIQVRSAGLTDVSVQVPAINVPGRVIASGGGPLPKLNYIGWFAATRTFSTGFPIPTGVSLSYSFQASIECLQNASGLQFNPFQTALGTSRTPNSH